MRVERNTEPGGSAKGELRKEKAPQSVALLDKFSYCVGCVNGPDDLIATSGDEAALAILDTAKPFAECAHTEAESAIVALETDKKGDPLPAIEAMSAVEDPMRRALLIGRLSGLRIGGLTKRLTEQSVGNYRAELQQSRKNSAEVARRGQLLRVELNPPELFANLAEFFSVRAWLPPHAALVMALFTMLTHCLEHFSTAPYLCFESATPGCGKSTCLDLLVAVVVKPLLSAGLSRAVLVRILDETHATLLLDESECGWPGIMRPRKRSKPFCTAVIAVAHATSVARAKTMSCASSRSSAPKRSAQSAD